MTSNDIDLRRSDRYGSWPRPIPTYIWVCSIALFPRPQFAETSHNFKIVCLSFLHTYPSCTEN